MSTGRPLRRRLRLSAAGGGDSTSVTTVAARAARLARRPRPVVSIPRWRGAQVRLLDAFPGVAMRLAPVVLAIGRAGQRRIARRIAAGRWP